MAHDDDNALIVMPPGRIVGESKKGIEQIITNSTPMAQIAQMVLRIAPSNLSILITGESGVGKQVIAEAIHSSSLRKGPFIDTHCASFSPTLLEDELFGHEKGAYTGAVSSKKGIFERANGGTLFLDEIGEIDSVIQVKLLKVLEEKRFIPLGGEREIKSDFRLICATNRNLKKEVEEGRFREDLYYRINKMTLEIPPLRERKNDIMALAASFLKKYSAENNKKIVGFTEEAAKMLLNYRWPGNIRELQNVIEAGTVLVKSDFITSEELPCEIVQSYHKNDSAIRTFDSVIEQNKENDEEQTTIINSNFEKQGESYVTIKLGTLKEMEKELIKATLEYYDGNKSRAAAALGINRKTLSVNE